MIINSVKLHNIRSYEDELVEFPEGNVLLSGDIGSGKSTILLAVEFALFGIMRGGLSGTSLLRRGRKKGSVELNFTINDEDVTVHRELKRRKDSVGQDSGYIMKDGVKFEGTPTELKARIIEMIGYPQELVSRSKSLIFRYTVYTPQEQMKQILFEGDDARLDTLRKIFDIDKYKRIRENSVLLGRDLKSDRKVLQSQIEDLPGAKKKLKEKKEREKKLEEKKSKVVEKIEKQEKKAEKAKEKVEELEKKSEERRAAEKKLEAVNSTLINKKQTREQVRKDKEKLEKETKKLEKELEDKDVSDIEKVEKKISEKEKELRKKEELLSKVREKEAVRESQKKNAEKLKKKIGSMKECPTCGQEVTEDHKHKVADAQDKSIKEADEKLDKAEKLKKSVKKKTEKLRKEIQELRKKEKKLASLKERFKSLDDKKERLQNYEKRIEKANESIEELEDSKKKLRKELEETKDFSKQLKESRKRLDEMKEVLNEFKVKQAGTSKELEAVKESIAELVEDVDNMKKDRKKLKDVNKKLEWLEEYFQNAMEVMEKQVMLSIYQEFNEYFVEWFDVLMEDETINVRLDDKFSPEVVQDGYETGVEDLSGGEKTSVALAYRLSLNRVINDYIGTIKTKGIIILDEPTDGFSSEQLDRVREVLERLDVQQVIVVSHEPKMETYVDNVIRVSKHNHVSWTEKNI